MIPFAQSLSLTQWVNYWMNELSQYEPILYFDWDTLINLIEREPLAMTAVGIAFLNILLTILFKVSDYCKEAMRERLQRGKLHIEAYAIADADMSEATLQVVLTNTGRETIVIRDIGYQKRPFFKCVIHNLSPFSIAPDYFAFERAQCKNDLVNGSSDQPVQWPIAIAPREFFEFRVQGHLLDALSKKHHRFSVRDSLGTLWLYRGKSPARISRTDKPLKTAPKQLLETRADEALQVQSSATSPALFDPGQPVNLMLMDQNLLHFDTNAALSTQNPMQNETPVASEFSTRQDGFELEASPALSEK